VERKSSSERANRRRHLVGRVGHSSDVASSGKHLIHRQAKKVSHGNYHRAAWAAALSFPSAYSLLADANQAPELSLIEPKSPSPFPYRGRKPLHQYMVRIYCVRIAIWLSFRGVERH
jgi:hypothetical protein